MATFGECNVRHTAVFYPEVEEEGMHGADVTKGSLSEGDKFNSVGFRR